ncbi:MAG: GyrI-like domain-containing protein [Gammaproteobacteria bacterium]|nr:GyrI-like domain-containing protein [Gammaproteobacteria bacterium]
MKVEITERSAIHVAAIRHHGAPELEIQTVRKMIDWRIANGAKPAPHTTFALYYADPATTSADDYFMDSCVAFEPPIAANPQGAVARQIPGGGYAMARDVGSRFNNRAAAYLYREWLPESGYLLDVNRPMIFDYVNVGPAVAPADMITEVYLPIVLA